MVSVLDYGAAGDGKTDDTSAFQKALADVGGKGGGIVVAPAPHAYLINGTLSLPKLTTLEGSYRCVPSHDIRDETHPSPYDGGSTLLAISGRGSEEGAAFITIGEDSTLKGFLIFYPEQSNKGIPVAYPYTIQMSGNNPAVIDVELLNSYNGISAVGSARHYISRIQGQPLHIGMYIDEIYDIGRIENVHFNPWFSMEAALFGWQKENGIAFIFGRSDWEYVFNTFAFGYSVGYKFIATKTGSMNGNLLGIGADLMTMAAIEVEQSDPYGLLITNGEFTAFQGKNSTHVVVRGTNTGSIRFVNCAFWGPAFEVAKISGKGRTSFTSCVFSQWESSNYAINSDGGDITISASEFQYNAPQVHLGEGTNKAVIMGNIITGEERITNHAKNGQIGLNAAD